MVEVYHITFFIYPNDTTMKEQVTEKRPYEAPQLTVVTFKAERGYANSPLTLIAISTILQPEQSSAVSRGDYGVANDGISNLDNGVWNW